MSDKTRTIKEKFVAVLPVVGIISAYVAIGGAIVGLSYLQAKAIKVEQDRIDAAKKARTQMFIDAATRGDSVLPNDDGSFWIIPNRQAVPTV